MNRPAVCVIQYTPWTGISSYKRGTISMCLLHQIQYMWNFIMYITTVHIITITQHYNIAQRVVCTISQPSKVSAQLHKVILPYSSNLYLWLYQAVFLSLLLWTSSYPSHLYLYLWLFSSNSTSMEQLIPTVFHNKVWPVANTAAAEREWSIPISKCCHVAICAILPCQLPTVFTISSLPYCHMSILYYLACICQWLIPQWS